MLSFAQLFGIALKKIFDFLSALLSPFAIFGFAQDRMRFGIALNKIFDFLSALLSPFAIFVA